MEILYFVNGTFGFDFGSSALSMGIIFDIIRPLST